MNALLGTHLGRCLKPETAVGNPQFHGFSDAGELGYGGALFLRWELANGKFTSRFVAAKALIGCATEEEDNTKTRTDGLLEQTTDKLLVTMGTLKKFLTEFWPGHRPFAKQEE